MSKVTMRQKIERNRSLGSFEALCDVLCKGIHIKKKALNDKIK